MNDGVVMGCTSCGCFALLGNRGAGSVSFTTEVRANLQSVCNCLQ